MTKILDVDALTVMFQNAQRSIIAIDQVSFNLRPGETVALLGESGCGKSLTSLALMRLLPPNSVYGQQSVIRLATAQSDVSQDILLLPEAIMRQLRGRRLAMIFQEPMTALNPVLSIGEQLAECILQQQRLSRNALKKRVLELLTEVEITNPAIRLRQYPHQLSGGQKQRIMIAMALANHPEILIADEPTTALDVTIQAQILSLLKKLQQQYQMSLLLITHDLSVVKNMADQVCVMYAGQIVEITSAQQFFTQPLHPYVQKMMVTLPSLARRHQRLQVIAGQVPQMDALPSGCRFHPRCPHVFALCRQQAPELETMASNRYVRCHLYPERSHPPPLPMEPDILQSPKKITITKECLLSVQQLSVNFSIRELWHRHIYHAVNQVSFNIYRGQTLALVGESGCGKTTIARVIMRLKKSTAGAVYYRDQNIAYLSRQALHQFRQRVQIIFQDPFSSMNPRMTIGEILAEGLLAQGLRASAIQKKQYQLLEQVNLPRNSLRRYPHQFSGGQRQRVCIARALATEPELLICDEPTSALDVSVQAQILNLLKELQVEYGLSYLFITHNMAVVAYIADEVCVMRDGQIVEMATCEQLFTQPQQEYTKRLLSGVLEVVE